MRRQYPLFIFLVFSFPIIASFGEHTRVYAQSSWIDAIPVYLKLKSDPVFLKLLEDFESRPESPQARDALLMYMPISPLTFFNVHMRYHKREYPVPSWIEPLEKRWQELHGQSFLSPDVNTPASLDRFLPRTTADPSAPVSILAASVGTNRNCAANFTPDPEEYQGEIQIAVNPGNPDQIVAAANTWYCPVGDQTQAIFYSADGGNTWGFTCAPSFSAYSGISCNRTAFGSDPSVYWDASGNVYLNYMLLCCRNLFCNRIRSNIVTARSTDGGQTWSGWGVTSANGLGTGGFDDKNMMVIDTHPGSPYQGRVYVCWDIDNVEYIAYSDNGTSWTAVQLPDISGDLDLGCDMDIGEDGKVYIVWNTLTCGATCTNERTWFSKSTDGGNSWSAPVLVRDHNFTGFSGEETDPPAQDDRGINAMPAIARDNNPSSPCYGTLYVTYTDKASASDRARYANVYVQRSTDGGSTWSAPVKVNDNTNNSTQFHPWISVDPTDGSVYVAWHDTRDLSDGMEEVDYYLSRSVDCGVTWEANIKVSMPSSEFNNSTISYSNENTAEANENPNQYGEYMGVDAFNRVVYLAWSDTRHFFPSFTSENDQENVGFVKVTFCSPPVGLSPPTVSTSCNAGSPEVQLSWSAPSDWGTNATGGTYEVQRATVSGGPYVTIATGLTTTSYTDTTASPSTQYYYRIVAKNNCPGTSLTPMTSASGETSVLTPSCAPGEPVQLIIQKSGNQLQLTWTGIGGGCGGTDYAVYQGTLSALQTGSYDHAAVTCTTGGLTSYSMPLPATDGVYFIVTSLNGSEEGSYGRSVDASGTTTERPQASVPCKPASNRNAC